MCLILVRHISKLSIISYVISKVFQVRDNSFLHPQLYNSEHFPMLIGDLVPTLENPLLVFASFLEIHQYPGKLKSKRQFLDPPLRLSTVLWLLLQVNSLGYDGFFQSYIYLVLNRPFYFVIIKRQSILHLIRFFTNVLNISK